MQKKAVVAIGGNSIIQDKDHQSISEQFEYVKETCNQIAKLIKQEWKIVITHGNGIQVGFILLRSEITSKILHPLPLDSCVAETQGGMGYMLQQCMHNEFRKLDIKKQVVTMVTQVLVDKNDPAFQNPTKPIGIPYEKKTAELNQREKGWKIAEFKGQGWRRIVPSPKPIRIIEANAIKTLINQGFVVIAVGGGGVPVIEENGLKGIEAVIDKDYASALLAADINADIFLISTAVEKVSLNFNKSNQKFLDKININEAKKYFNEGHFPPGNMGPKIQAAINFLEAGGKEVIITNPVNITNALLGLTGTHIFHK
jgi:carbamate kinase